MSHFTYTPVHSVTNVFFVMVKLDLVQFCGYETDKK